ncbi:MAG: cobalamin-dependent protein [Saprospiraceae bacterium]|nr:cobalamin-dependent protein [Saprospiraceae bacterium]
MTDFSHKEFLGYLISGNCNKCSNIAHDFLSKGMSIIELYEEIFKKALYDVGELWEYNKISVATEHLASAIVEGLLNELYTYVASQEKTNKIVLVACVEEEHHQIGIKMIGDIFEMNFWDSYFLGANTPVNELIKYAKLTNPNIIALSLSIYFHLPILEKMIIQIRKEFPDLLILIGGQAFKHGGEEILSKYQNVILKKNLIDTEEFIKKLNKNG